jgi:DnaD/phage-associated family protein
MRDRYIKKVSAVETKEEMPQYKVKERKGKEIKGKHNTSDVIFQYFGAHFQDLTDKTAEKLNDAINFYSAEWVFDALKKAKDRNKCTWGYAEAILKNRDSAGKNSKPSIERNKPTEFQGQFSASTNARVAAQFKAAREEDDKKAKGAK